MLRKDKYLLQSTDVDHELPQDTLTKDSGKTLTECNLKGSSESGATNGDGNGSETIYGLDGVSLARPHLDEMQRSWLLRPTECKEKKEKKKKYLDIASRKSFFICIIGAVLVTAFVVGFTTLKTVPHHKAHDHKQPPPDNYTLALHKAMNFFNAQQSGKLPENNNVSWRGDSCLQDGNIPGILHRDLVGGYYDGGGAIKSNFHMSFAMTMLSWSVIEYGSKFQVAGELNHVKGLIKWGTDYFLKTFHSSADTIDQMVSQIESVPNDNSCWMRPEDIDSYKRRLSMCHSDCPQLPAEMAAALASASIVFKENNGYAQRLLQGAKTLYQFAESMTDDASRGYWDEIIWSGTWMYYATGDVVYLDRVTSPDLAERAGTFSRGPDLGVFNRDNKLPGAQLLLTRLRLFLGPGYPYEEILRTFHKEIDRMMCSYLPYFDTFNRTKGGLIELNHGDPQPLQYAANAAFLAALFSDYLDASRIPGWYCGPSFYSVDVLRNFSGSQIDYILGKNPRNMSYVVGFGQRYPKHVHHRGASIPKNKKVSCRGGLKWKESKKENPNTIQGAMVGGPDRHDGFQDVRANQNYTEPTLAGNAGLVAALVALSGDRGVIDKNTLFSAIPPLYPATPPPPAPWRP